MPKMYRVLQKPEQGAIERGIERIGIERGLVQLVDNCETSRTLSTRCTGYELVEVKCQRVSEAIKYRMLDHDIYN